MDHLFKNFWFWVVLVLVVGAVFFYLNVNLPEPGGTPNSAQLTIRFDNNKTRAFEGPVEGSTTILQALLSASHGGDFDVRYFLDKSGRVNLESIGGITNGSKSWHFYLNGKSIETKNINKTTIKNGDSVEARYE